MNKQKSAEGIIVDDGTETVSIYNRSGETVGTLRFRPSDPGIVARCRNIRGQIASIVQPLTQIDINPDGTTSDINAALLRDTEQRLYETCNYIFGNDFSTAFFSQVHPFSIVGGRFYCQTAIETVAKYIERRCQNPVKSSTETNTKSHHRLFKK